MANDNNASDLPNDKPITAEKEMMYLKGLPQVIRTYLTYEAAIDWSTRAVYGMYRKEGTERTLAQLRFAQAMDTTELYDEQHPQSHYNLR